MLSKNKIKFLQSLSAKKNREETGLFITEGEKSIQEFLISNIKIKTIIGKEELKIKNQFPDIEYLQATEAEIRKISSLQTPQGILAVCEQPNNHLPSISELINCLTLALDNIQDPGNLGTIIRLASWFGIQHIICSMETVDCYNPKVVQATMGAISKVAVHYTSLKEVIEEYTENRIPVYGTFMEGENLYSAPLSKSGLIVMGNEGKGISNELKQLITKRITIPNFSSNASNVESLNVSIATAIICAEFRRRLTN